MSNAGGRRRRPAMATEAPTKARIITPAEQEANKQHARLRQYVEQQGYTLHHLPPYSDVKSRDDAPPMYVGPASPCGHTYYGQQQSVRFTRDHRCVLCVLGPIDFANEVRAERVAARKLTGGKLTCRRCGKTKARAAFSKRKTSPTGRRAECRQCQSALNHEYYLRRKAREQVATTDPH